MIYTCGGHHPQIDKSVFIAPGACIIGNVQIDRDEGIWFQFTVRGDINSIHTSRRGGLR